jgi:hypothetical protein
MAKMEAHAAAMKATDEAKHLSLAKMTQDSKILMATMDPLARAWHEMMRQRISNEVTVALAASPSAASAPTTFMPPSAPVELEPVLEVSPVLAADEEVFPL